MNLIGKWKIKEVFYFSPECLGEWKTQEELEALGADESFVSICKNTVVLFKEDGTMEDLLALPKDATQEQIDQAIAEGKEIRDGMMVIDKNCLKTEDGKNLYDSGVEGEIMGEEASRWHEIEEIDEDTIQLGIIRYVRAE